MDAIVWVELLISLWEPLRYRVIQPREGNPASSDAKKHRKRSRPDKRLFQTYVESFRQKKESETRAARGIDPKGVTSLRRYFS